MACRGESALSEEFAESSSIEVSYAVSTSTENDFPGLTESCPPLVERSKDKWYIYEGPSNFLTRLFSRSVPTPPIGPLTISSAAEPPANQQPIVENQQPVADERTPLVNNQELTDRPRTKCCSNFPGCLIHCARKIRDSWFIYIFQLVVALLSVSAIVMGIIFFKSCDGNYPSADPLFAILMGIFSLVLVYKWWVKVFRQRRGDYFWNHEKCRIIMYLSFAMFFMAVEFFVFMRMEPKMFQEDNFKCDQIYYEYLYYLHIVNAGCLLLASFLYLPDCCLYMYSYRRLEPSQANGHAEPV